MTFFGIGAFEAIVIMIVALLILGPGRLPEVMGEAGRALRDFRRMSRELTGGLDDSIGEIRDSIQEVQTEVRGTVREISQETTNIGSTITGTVDDAVQDANPATQFEQKSPPRAAASRAPASKPAAANTPDQEPAIDESESKQASREDPLADLIDLDDDIISSNGTTNTTAAR